jgi:hypothetical protein
MAVAVCGLSGAGGNAMIAVASKLTDPTVCLRELS